MGLLWWRKPVNKQSFSERFDHVKAQLDSATADLNSASATAAKTRSTITLLGLSGLAVILVVLVGIVGPSRWSLTEWSVLVGWPSATMAVHWLVSSLSSWHIAKLDKRVKAALEDTKKIGFEIDQDANLQSMMDIRAQVAAQTGELPIFPPRLSGRPGSQRGMAAPALPPLPHMAGSTSSFQQFNDQGRQRRFGASPSPFDRNDGLLAPNANQMWGGPPLQGQSPSQPVPQDRRLSAWQRALHSVIDFVAGDVREDETDGPPLVCTFCQTENFTVLAREMATRVHRWLCTECNQLNDIEGDWDGISNSGGSVRGIQSRVASGQSVPPGLFVRPGSVQPAGEADRKTASPDESADKPTTESTDAQTSQSQARNENDDQGRG